MKFRLFFFILFGLWCTKEYVFAGELPIFYQSFGVENGLFNTTINDVILAQGSERYFASEGSGLIHFRNGTFSYYNVPEGLQIPFISSILYINKDTLIIASENELYFYFTYSKLFSKISELPKQNKIRKLYQSDGTLYAHSSNDSLYRISIDKGAPGLYPVFMKSVQRVCSTPSHLYVLSQDTLIYRITRNKIEKYFVDNEKILNIGFFNNLLQIFYPDKIIQINDNLVRRIILSSAINEARNISANNQHLIARISENQLLSIDIHGRINKMHIHPTNNRFFLLQNGELWVNDTRTLKCYLFPSVSVFMKYDFSDKDKVYDIVKTGDNIVFSMGSDLYRFEIISKKISKIVLPKKIGLIIQILALNEDTLLLNAETGLYIYSDKYLSLFSEHLDQLYSGLVQIHPKGLVSIPKRNTLLLMGSSDQRKLMLSNTIIWHHWIDTATLCVQSDSALHFYKVDAEKIIEVKSHPIPQRTLVYADKLSDKIWGLTDEYIYVFKENELAKIKTSKILRDNISRVYDIGNDTVIIISDQLYFLYPDAHTIKKQLISYSDWLVKQIKILDFLELDSRFFIISHTGILEVEKDILFRKNSPKIILKNSYVNGVSKQILSGNTLKSTENTLHINFAVLSDIFAEKEYRYRFIIASGMQKADTVESSMPELYLSNLNPDKYIITYQLLSADNEILSFGDISFSILKPLWEQVWFLVLIIIVVFGFSAYIIRWRTHQLRERVKLKEMLLETETKALRLQMNPHFLYNSLESIEGFILKSDKISAIRHLNNFTRLMRLILEGSDKGIHTLQREKDILSYYLELEKMRSGNAFDYLIEVSPQDVNPHEIFIPSMIIQPHVENSIIHGIRPLKEQVGKISVTFIVHQHEQCVEVLIEDNGVGRRKSSELSVRNDVKSKSMALNINAQRLKMMSHTYNKMFYVSIVDKFDTFGVSSGTLVRIKMPIVKE